MPIPTPHTPPGSDAPEPIAIIGLSCRYSGIADTPDGLWQMLSKGMTSWSRNARNRFNLDAFWHPKGELAGSFNPSGLHLLNQNPAAFDNGFFSINGAEAKAIDPQQRLLLEVAYEAIENAGIPLEQLEGSQTGVYCANSYQDYDQILGRDPEVSASYRFTGTGSSILANRISYVFDLRGPSISIDTACSSTLVAIHEACRALRMGDMEQVIVGGVNMIMDPDKSAVQSSMQFLSPDGRCYSFDSRANGYGRGEGVAVIFLKPLSAALRDGDAVRAVIRGTSIVSDGRTQGITMPSGESQLATIQKAYQYARLDPSETLYVETHGTGTKAGDKAEVTAVANTFCKNRRDRQKVFIGSIKSNIGHTENASGLAAMVKAVLILENGIIPPNPTFSQANEELALDECGIQVPTQCTPWPKDIVRRASVNGTGYGGTNAHVILERPSSVSPVETQLLGQCSQTIETQRPYTFVLTHKHDGGLSKWARKLKRHVLGSTQHPETLTLEKLAFTLGSRRSHFSYRAAITASKWNELLDGLDRLASGMDQATKHVGRPRICLAFTGQGAQWAGMGRELLAIYPVFARSMLAAEEEFISLGANWSLLSEVTKTDKESFINEARLAQPCCTAIQIALVDLLESWGVKPSTVCGHSSGEIAAAYAAGILTAKDALRVAYCRGYAIRRLKEVHSGLHGSMMAVGLSEAAVEQHIHEFAGQVVVACINSPSSVTLSGDREAMEKVQKSLQQQRVFNRMLAVDVAYHSHHMGHVRQTYLSSLTGIHAKTSSETLMISSVTGHLVDGKELGPEYWVQNLLSPVRFSDAVVAALKTSRNAMMTAAPPVVIEVGPHGALRGPVLQIFKSSAAGNPTNYLSVLTRNEDAARSVINFAGSLFIRGVPIQFNAVNHPGDRQSTQVLTSLPPYQWNHDTLHWQESRRSAGYRFRQFPRHELLGTPVLDNIDAEPTWRNYLRLSELPWLNGHCISGQIVFPAAGHITMVIEALRQQCLIAGDTPWRNTHIQFRDIIIGRPLLITEGNTLGTETFIQLRPYTYTTHEPSTSWKEFRVFSTSAEGKSTEHCRGLVMTRETRKSQLKQVASDEGPRYRTLDPKNFYKELHSLGNEYSGLFTNLSEIEARPWESRCQFPIPDVAACMPAGYCQKHTLHPATLEACFQSIFPALKMGGELKDPVVLTAIEELNVSSDFATDPGTYLCVEAQNRRFGAMKYSGTLQVINPEDHESQPCLEAKGVVFTAIRQSRSNPTNEKSSGLCHRLEWGLDLSCSSPTSIVDHCKLGVSQFGPLHLRKNCDPLCLSWIHQTLADLSPTEEQKISGHLRLFLDWLHSNAPKEPPSLDKGFEEHVKGVGAAGQLVAQVGPHLRSILLGEVDPLSILLQNDLLYNLYFDDDTLNRCHVQLINYIKLAQFKNPEIRILEVGGGTGSLAIPLLEALLGNDDARLGKYVFTDISTGFLSNTQSKLDRYQPFVEFKKFDMEISAEKQGFEIGSFDFIVASNVVHVTHSLTQTLTNLRGLLKPGGQLAYVEITEPSLRWTMLGGPLPGWWLGAEEGRVSSPLLSAAKWDHVLKASGFSGVSLEMKDYDSEEDHELSVIITTSTSTPEPLEPSPVESVSIVVSPGNYRVSQQLVQQMNSQDISASASSLMDTVPGNRTFIMLVETISCGFLASLSQEEWNRVREILCQAKAVLWVTRGGTVECSDPRHALITGIARSVRSEDDQRNVFTIDLDPAVTLEFEIANGIHKMYEYTLGHGPSLSAESEFEFALRGGNVMIPRLMVDHEKNQYIKDMVSDYHPQWKLDVAPSRCLQLQIQTPGLLDTLYWADSSAHTASVKPHEVRVDLKYLAINHRDVMTAMGQLDGHTTLIMEGSGTVIQVGDAVQEQFAVGDSVCVFEPDGLATISNVDARQAFHIPLTMDQTTAGAVLVAYATALYSIRDAAHLQSGDSILIHSGAGAVGQASIALAKSLDAGAIFVTVGSEEKRNFVRERFGIPDENIFSSRDLNFGQAIDHRTQGHGVDIVLSSLTGDAIRESCRVLAPFGRFVEIGKKDLVNNGRLEMRYLKQNITFSVVDMALLAKKKPKAFHQLAQDALAMASNPGTPDLGPLTTSPITEVEETFRTMQTGKHIGKLVLERSPGMSLRIQPAKPQPAALRPDGSYLVVGNDDLGKAVVRFLARLGATRIITLCRPGQEELGGKELAEELREMDANLEIVQGSIIDPHVVERIQKLGAECPLRGVIQGPTYRRDGMVKNTTFEMWRDTIEPKMVGTPNLDKIIGCDLDFVVLISSLTAITGGYAQGGDSAGSAFLDAFARRQASRGLPVHSINIDLEAREGVRAEAEKLANFLAVLHHVIQHPQAPTVGAAQVICGARRIDPKSGTEEAARQRADAKFCHTYARTDAVQSTTGKEGAMDAQSELRAATNAAKAIEVTHKALQQKVAQLLLVPERDLDASRSVASYGVDSLISVELQNWITAQLGGHVQTVELMSSMGMVQLAEMIAQRSRLVPAGVFAKE
ncbi:hypothetical protein AWENTII_010681 [Aspergillus wentii]